MDKTNVTCKLIANRKIPERIHQVLFLKYVNQSNLRSVFFAPEDSNLVTEKYFEYLVFSFDVGLLFNFVSAATETSMQSVVC